MFMLKIQSEALRQFTFLLILSITGISFLHGQPIRTYDLEMQAQHAEVIGYDPSYRVNYFENIIIKTEFTSDVANLQFTNGRTGEVLDLKPVSEYFLGTTFDYKWVALGVYFTPKFLTKTANNPDIKRGESFKVKLNFFYSDRWRQELSYSYNKGFFFENQISSSQIEEGYLSNTTLNIFTGSTFFIANRNYSFRAHYAQTERQLKSAGSIIPRITYSYSWIQPNLQSSGVNDDLKQINSIDIFSQVGYLHTFVHNKKWFATAGLHPGIGYTNSSYKYDNGLPEKEVFNNFTLGLSGELAMGYNSYRWFFGGNLQWRNYNYSNNQEDQFSRDNVYFSLHLGYRFNDNKPMRKFFGWFEDKLGF